MRRPILYTRLEERGFQPHLEEWDCVTIIVLTGKDDWRVGASQPSRSFERIFLYVTEGTAHTERFYVQFFNFYFLYIFIIYSL